jgi:hypothetical protein
MTSHELAQELLELPDQPCYTCFWDENEASCLDEPMIEIHLGYHCLAGEPEQNGNYIIIR